MQLGLGVYSPSFVLADGHRAIDSSMQQSFPGAVRLMCSYHAEKAMKDQSAKKLPNSGVESPRVMAEIAELQLAPSSVAFQRAGKALVELWRSPQRNLAEFAQYFEDNWLKRVPNW